MLVQPIEIVIHENVMPWLIGMMADFLADEEHIDVNSNDVVRDAFEMGKDEHKKAIEAEKQRK